MLALRLAKPTVCSSTPIVGPTNGESRTRNPPVAIPSDSRFAAGSCCRCATPFFENVAVELLWEHRPASPDHEERTGVDQMVLVLPQDPTNDVFDGNTRARSAPHS